MSAPDLAAQARDLLVQLRRDTLAREETLLEAREQVNAACDAANHDQKAAGEATRRQRETAELDAAKHRNAAIVAADAALVETRRRAAGYAESIRSHWAGADTALGLADLRGMQTIALERVAGITSAPTNVDAEAQLARCVTEAGKAARRIDGGVQQFLAERAKPRPVYPRLILAGAVALASAALLAREAVQPCSFIQTATGIAKHCSQAPKPSSGALPETGRSTPIEAWAIRVERLFDTGRLV